MDIAQDGNLFPREDILEAVAQSDWRDQPVHAGAWTLGALGLAAMALGTPVLEPLVTQPSTFTAEGSTLIRQPVHVLARALGSLGLGIESAWYWLSALSMALALPTIGAGLRTLGIGARLSFVVALLALISPLAWTHGRLPSNYGFGVLGAALAFALVCAPLDPGDSGKRGYGVRLALAVVMGTMLHTSNLLLAAPLAVAAWKRGTWQSLLPVLVGGLAGLHIYGRSLLSGSGPVFGIGLDSLFALGALGLAIPLVVRTGDEESPPPGWLWIWLGAGLIAGKPLVTVALASIAAATLTRFARPDNALRASALLFGLQLAGLAWAHVSVPTTQVCGLAESGPELFRSGDIVVLQQEPDSQAQLEGQELATYLLRRRFGVPVMPLSETPPFVDKGRRIALDLEGIEHIAGGPEFALNPRTAEIYRLQPGEGQSRQ